jgi:two-component system sensor histidine kinase RstB
MTRLVLRLLSAVAFVVLLGHLTSTCNADRSLRHDAQRVLSGPAQLIASRLAAIPPPERAREAEVLSRRFGYPVRLETESVGGHPYAEWRGSELALIAPLPDGSGQAVLGPVPMVGTHGSPWLWVLAVLIIGAILVLVAAWPLVRGVHLLEELAARMCEGNFAVRSQIEPEEPLSLLGDSLNQLADRIGQLLSDERDLMRTVAHEVRAPISRMRFRIDMLQEAESDQRERHLSGLVTDLRQVDSLFEELLTYVAFDEFDHERPELTTSTFCLGEAVRLVVSEIADTAPHVEISVEGNGEAMVVANRKLFDRAVANLVRNAVNYCNTRVSVVMRRFPKASVVDVQDDGPGIPELERPRVIKPFVRLERAGRKVRGTGLGLAIVTRIMNLHHGSLHLVDAPRGGASCQLVWSDPAVQAPSWRDAWARSSRARGRGESVARAAKS